MNQRTTGATLWVTHTRQGIVEDDCLGHLRIQAFFSKEECESYLEEGEVAIPYHAAPQAILEPTDALQALRERSGQVEIQSRLVGFLYDLLRDHLTPGVVEQIMRDTTDQPCLYTNGWLARYAEDLANRLTAGPSASGIATGQQLPGSDVVLPSRSENTLIPQTPQ